MTINQTIDDVTDSFFLKKKSNEIVNVDGTSYCIKYSDTYNVLGATSMWGKRYEIMMWQFAPDCKLVLSAYPISYDVPRRQLIDRLALMDNIIKRSHDRFNTEFITVCEPRHYYKPGHPERYDLCANVNESVVLKVIPVVTVQQPVTFEQMAVLL